ncbi:MAG: sodium-independent anion transporter [Pseudomonadota bacterium]
MHPRIVRVTKDPEHNTFINADTFEKPSCPQILQLRVENAIFFANAEYTVEHILERLDERVSPVKTLLLDFQGVGFIDITGVDELRALQDEVQARGMDLALMGVHLPVKQVMKSTGFINEIKRGHLIENRGEAITFLFQQIDHGYCKKVCPYELFFECPTVK